MSFTFTSLAIPQVILIEAKVFTDERGFFIESYKRSEFVNGGITCTFVQDNRSHSLYRTLRGLHYQQNPAAQGKLVSAIRGEIFDVAVDIRKGSPTYGQSVSAILSEQNCRLLYIPEGFAHGFQVLSEDAGVVYKVTAEYSPNDERGILWSDPFLKINWPRANPLISARDARLPNLKDAENNFEYRT
ncbi:MAG: dTDP-4-dehydrorhamnose 3,5-epimerase [Alphaproteobacteria bacterium]